MTRLSTRIADTVIHYRGRVLILLVVAGAIAAVFALRVRTDLTPEDLFAGAAEQRDETEAFREYFGNTDNIAVVLVRADDILEPGVLQYVHDLTRHLQAAEYSEYAVSITTVPMPRRTGPAPSGSSEAWPALLARDLALGRLTVNAVVDGDRVTADDAAALRAALADMPLLDGKLISKDRTVAVIALQLTPEVERVDELMRAVGAIERRLRDHPPPDGARAYVGGLPFLRTNLIRNVKKDQATLFPAAIIVILVLLLLTFRWWPAIVLPMLVVGLAAGLLMGAMGVAGQSINIINNIVPILVIIIGISDSIHLINRFGEELTEARDRREAARRALRTMIVAMFLTSFTTAVGFASLVVSDLSILSAFGLTAAGGVLLAYVATIGLLPAALTFVPRPRRRIADVEHGVIERLIGPLTAAVLRRRVVVLVAFAALAAGAAWAARGVPIDTAVGDQFDDDDPVYATVELIESKLDGVRPVEVMIHTPGRADTPRIVNALDRTAAWARTQRGVLAVTTYGDLLHEAWYVITADPTKRSAAFDAPSQIEVLGGLLARGGDAATAAYLTGDGTRTRMSIGMADIGGRDTVAFVHELEHRLRDELSGADGVDIAVTGEGYVSSAGLDIITSDLLESLLLAVGVIFAFLILVLRSVRLGLISIPPNVLPLVATLAYLDVRGIPLSPGTVIIFSISIGLAVDGTIHYLARFREELRAGRSRDDALRLAARGTGKAVVVSYVSLIIGFTAFQLSAMVPIRHFGELISVTVFVCMLSTLIVLPALISLVYPDRADG